MVATPARPAAGLLSKCPTMLIYRQIPQIRQIGEMAVHPFFLLE
jgi:hypothetical protein